MLDNRKSTIGEWKRTVAPPDNERVTILTRTPVYDFKQFASFVSTVISTKPSSFVYLCFCYIIHGV